MEYKTIIIFSAAFVLIIFTHPCDGKEAEAMDDDDDEESFWTSRGKKSSQEEYCVAGDGKCQPKPEKKVSNTEGPTPPHVAANMHDKAAKDIIDTVAKYAKDFTEGNMDWKSLLQTEYGKKISQALLTGGLPGGNPAVGAAFKVFRTFMNSMGKWEKGIKKDGLNLKSAVDEINKVMTSVVPLLVLAIQHADRSCKKSALCGATKIAADIEAELPRDISLLLSNAAGAYLDYDEKKKSEYMKVVECCSQTEETLFKKCSAKYIDVALCSLERLMESSNLKPVDVSHLDFLKELLPKF